jgi:hypothetical protein
MFEVRDTEEEPPWAKASMDGTRMVSASGLRPSASASIASAHR